MPDLQPPPDPAATLDRLLALCEPARRDLFFFIAEHGGWVSRDEAAGALGLRRGRAAHHLDRLADDGLLETTYRRLTGRSGPGAGRPAKLYRRAELTFELTIPARNQTLLGALLGEAIASAGVDAEPVRRQLSEVARDAGVAAGRDARHGRSPGEAREGLTRLLARLGYAPAVADGELSLSNCPYEPLSASHRDLVCTMNLALVEGAAEGVGLWGSTCSLRAPTGGGCCVRVAPWPESDR